MTKDEAQTWISVFWDDLAKDLMDPALAKEYANEYAKASAILHAPDLDPELALEAATE